MKTKKTHSELSKELKELKQKYSSIVRSEKISKTNHALALKYGEIGREILQALNEPSSMEESIQTVLSILKKGTGFEAVGIRLQHGDDFPYFVQDGFSRDFLITENSLVERKMDGGVCRDKDGNIQLECTCGLVISGKTDPANPLFTAGGSSWTNNSFPFLEVPLSDDPRHNPRNNCIHKGYASVALIPIRNKEKIVGLIQFNDKWKDQFTIQSIEILEGIAAHIGSALMRKQAENELRLFQNELEKRVYARTEELLISNETIAEEIKEKQHAEDALKVEKFNLEAIFESSPIGMLIIDESTNIIMANAAIAVLAGVDESEIIRHRPGNALRCVHSSKDPRGCGYAKECKLCELRNGVELLIKDGGFIRGAELAVNLMRDEKEVKVCLKVGVEPLMINNNKHWCVALENITVSKQIEEDLKKNQKLLLETGQIGKVGGWEFNIDTLEQNWTEETYIIHELDFEFKPTVENGINYYTPESRPVIEEAVKRALETGDSWDLDLEIITAKGNLRSVNAIGKADLTNRRIYGFFQDITERKLMSGVQEFMLKCGHPGSGEEFFESLAKYLATILNMEYVCIDQLEGDGLTAKTLAIYNDGIYETNVSYALKETPCGDVVGKTICCFPENVCNLFPLDQALLDLKAISYIGTTLWSFDGKPIGLIAIIGQKPLKNAALAELVLKHVAVRAAGELERKQALETLRDNELKYRALFENAEDAILLFTEGSWVDCNEGALRVFGCTREQIIGAHPNKFSPPFQPDGLSSEEEAIKKINLAFEVGPQSFEWEHCREDKTTFAAEVSLNRLDLGGKSFIQAIVRDISERKHAEIKLRNEKERIRNILDLVGDPIFVKDNDYRFTHANQAFYKMLRLDENSVIGQTLVEALPENEMHHFLEVDRNVLDTGISDEREEELTVGSFTRTIITKKTCFENELGQKFLVGSIHDITERKKAEELIKQNAEEIQTQNEEYRLINEEYKQINDELFIARHKAEESDRLKSAFLANMSHEIRTPMNGIVGFADLLNSPNITNEKRKDFTAIIIERSNHLLNIVNDILDISKIEAGMVTVKNENVPINILLLELYTYYSNHDKLREIKLEVKYGIEDTKTRIYIDDTKMIQIFNNLISNALKFTSKGHIVFGYELKGKMLQFFVEDSGIGIPDDYKEKVFDRFIQVEMEFSKNHGGTGLGLSITKELVHLMGGEIWIESKLGVGTKVFFTMPYEIAKSEEELLIENPHLLNNKNIAGKSILIVDDDETNLYYLNEVTTNLELKVFKANNGFEAIEQFKNNTDISLILMDIKMPVMGGMEATKLIKSINSNVKVIAQTAHALLTEQDIVIAGGCDDYISKPIDREKLISLIRKHI